MLSLSHMVPLEEQAQLAGTLPKLSNLLFLDIYGYTPICVASPKVAKVSIAVPLEQQVLVAGT